MKIIVSGGGTGGHIYPAITIIRTLENMVNHLDVLYVGTSAGLEADIVPKEGFAFETVDLQGFKRSLSVDNFRRAFNALKSVKKAGKIVDNFKPDAVVGTGGYVCGPVLMAAALKGIPTLIQEQNVIPGITNKILSKFVTRIATGSREATSHFPKDKVIFTGNPIRSQVKDADRDSGYEEFQLDPSSKTVLVSGGSRGARSINYAMVDVLKHYVNKLGIQFLYATGKRDYEDIIKRLAEAGVDLDKADNIHVMPYLYNMPQAMATADLAIFRAGATGLAELTAKGIPAILIPYPYAAENHQEYNAKEIERAGGARVILDKELTADKLISILDELLANPTTLNDMARASKQLGRPEAAEEIAEMIIEMVRKKDRT